MIAVTTIFLPIIIIISLVFVFILKRNPDQKRFFYYGQKVKWFVLGYVIVLILSTIVYTFFLEEHANGEEEPQGESIEFATKDSQVYRVKDVTEKKQIKWEYKKENLHLNGRLDGTIPIIVERKEVNDNEIEAIYYMGRSKIENEDISDQFEPMDFNLEDDHLTIVRTGINIKKATFSKEFTITQFTKEREDGTHPLDETHPFMGRKVFIGERVIYLRIPKDLKLTYDDLYVRYVKE